MLIPRVYRSAGRRRHTKTSRAETTRHRPPSLHCLGRAHALKSERVKSVSGARNEQDNSDMGTTRNWLEPKNKKNIALHPQKGSDLKRKQRARDRSLTVTFACLPFSLPRLSWVILPAVIAGEWAPLLASRKRSTSTWVDNTSNPLPRTRDVIEPRGRLLLWAEPS